MSIAIQCPCGQRYNVPDAAAGQRLKCSRCEQVVGIPRPQGIAGPGTLQQGAAGRATRGVVTEARSAAPATKRCPFCAEEILAAAKKCKHCGEFVDREGNDPGGERVLLWRSSGMERTFLPGRYLALCITTRRIILVDLGSSLGWFLIFGLVGVAIGRGGARGRGQALARKSSDETLRRAPGSIVFNRSDVDHLELCSTLFGGRVLKIQSRRQGTREYTFDDLAGAHEDEVQNAIQEFLSGTANGPTGRIARPPAPSLFPMHFWWATLIPLFFYPLSPLALWLAWKGFKDATASGRNKGWATFAVVWSSLGSLLFAIALVAIIAASGSRR